jgi:polar amino acid transport system substrate-binding protein
LTHTLGGIQNLRNIKQITLGLIISCFFTATAQANVNQLTVAVGWNKPPYVISKNDSGFELDLVRGVFALMGYQIKPIYVPYGRTQKMLQRGQVDAAMSLSAKSGVNIELLSRRYISYQNTAISLKRDNLDIQQIEDLAKYSVVGFQNAAKNLGDRYAQAVAKAHYYMELPDQNKQVGMLLQGNIAVAVMDINIFVHLSRERTGKNQLAVVDTHNIFPATDYSVGFTNTALKTAFDKALSQYQNSHKYLELVKYYEFNVIPPARLPEPPAPLP